MLKALELAGFKSFADKTRFEFPPGITVVVGPNGSGKSNIVDAIKWVLGAQSAKALRGKEMADVIFKGSASGGRKAMNSAEATLIFDNETGLLPIDVPEVHVTRRVYRSGEGEYSINGQACRLRDIKDLFSGTGLGADAYSLIEQGKVDSLLQSSPKERRAIFEEAAGISRFKAKKIEAQRRLERVEQNLLRLSDIVEEVDNRVRSVRAQASKARRYHEYGQRLQELRTQVGITDWRHLTEQLTDLQEELEGVSTETDQMRAEAAEAESRAQGLEGEARELEEDVRSLEAEASENRERIAACDSTVAHEMIRLRDFQQEATRHRQQWGALVSRAGDLESQLRETKRLAQEAETEYDELSENLQHHAERTDQLQAQLETLRSDNEKCRLEHVESAHAATALEGEIDTCQSLLDITEQTIQRCGEHLSILRGECETARRLQATLSDQETSLVEQATQKTTDLETAQENLGTHREQMADAMQHLSELRGRLKGAEEKATVLDELQRRSEGVGTGVKEVLRKSREEPSGPFGGVRGMVADLLQVDVEWAHLIDAALDDVAQHVVVAGPSLLEAAQHEMLRVGSRVGFQPLDGKVTRREQRSLKEEPGVVGRAVNFVHVELEYQPLVERLLGNTWFVQTLAHAIQLSKEDVGDACFMTLEGEMLLADGTLLVGPRSRTTGLVSRRSQLRALQSEMEELRDDIEQAQKRVDESKQSITEEEQRVRLLNDESRTAEQVLSQQRIRLQRATEQVDQLSRQLEDLGEQAQNAREQQEATRQSLAEAHDSLATTQSQTKKLAIQIETQTSQIEACEKEHQHHHGEMMTAKVQSATRGQRLEGLRSQLQRFQQDRQERQNVLQSLQHDQQRCDERSLAAQRNILRATSSVAELYLHKEDLQRELEKAQTRRDEIAGQRELVSTSARKLRQKVRNLEDKQHKIELATGDLTHQRDSLVQRMRDDYGIELEGFKQEGTEEEQQERLAVEEEIEQLRRKISNIGAVNMDALEEIEELEERFGSLSKQYEDLNAAKESLQRIIHRINADSRRLFTETLETIRLNFQGLFRKMFGGGRADIQLEEDVDVLESGIDIVATPPGKQSLNISLLSGGEKALTAVTLLLAIFEFRPSPFCVLDEVDGPLDEANIGRFIDSLKGYLGWTRFVIVTHSKKTMTAASTLYGVTMQESGVSKRVSVQFEDVSDDGHISKEAIDKDSSAA